MRTVCQRPAPAGRGRSALPAVLVALVSLAVLASALPAGAGGRRDWRALLDRAATSGRDTPHTGEILWITHADGESHVVKVDVDQSRAGLTVRTPGQSTVRLSTEGGGLVDLEEGWFMPLPAARRVPAGSSSAMEDKYEVEVAGSARLLDRPATRVEVSLREGGILRERLWLDDATGLLLRRESYDGDELLRMAVYVSLDLSPRAQQGRESSDDAVPLEQRSQEVEPVQPVRLEALRQAGWSVPEQLGDGYRPAGAYALSGRDGSPLQLVYADGLYTVSLFQQRGEPDLSTLPPGAEPAEGLGDRAYEWPGAVPSRLVWEAGGTTYSLVGDAPPEEFHAMAAALPQAERAGVLERVGNGFSRLWSWVSPFS